MPDKNGVTRNGQNGRAPVRLTVRDFANHVKSSWCPGCGDFGVLAALETGAGSTRHRTPPGRRNFRNRLRL